MTKGVIQNQATTKYKTFRGTKMRSCIQKELWNWFDDESRKYLLGLRYRCISTVEKHYKTPYSELPGGFRDYLKDLIVYLAKLKILEEIKNERNKKH